MRIRKLLALGILAGALVGVLGAPAFAEDPGTKNGRELVDCVEKALSTNKASITKKDFTPFENALDNCRKAKSLFTPNFAEMLWGTVAFAVVAVILMKMGFPAIRKTIQARQDRIRNDLESAENSRLEAQRELEQYRAQIAGAHDEANRIVEEARQAGEQVRRDAVTRAEAEAADVRQRAQEDARLATARAMQDLRAEVAEVSIGLAEKIVGANLDAAAQQSLIESYITSVGNGSRG